MQLLRIDDPRDPLNKASRFELCALARHHGIAEITYGSPLQLPDMVRILRERGVSSITIPDRPLGVYKPVVYNADDVRPPPAALPVEPAKPEPVAKAVADMNMTEMRKECKRRGIKMERTDNLNSLRDKLGGQSHAA
jgi:hypothetical protein